MPPRRQRVDDDDDDDVFDNALGQPVPPRNPAGVVRFVRRVAPGGLAPRQRGGLQQPQRPDNVRARNWVATVWPPADDPTRPPIDVVDENGDIDLVYGDPQLPNGVDYLVGQLEQAGEPDLERDQHRPHWQLYIELGVRLNRDQVARLFGWARGTYHLEPREGTQQQAIDYVTKEDTRVGEPFTLNVGTRHPPDAANAMETLRAAVRQGQNFRQILDNDSMFASAVRLHNGVKAAIRAHNRPPPTTDPIDVRIYYGPTGSGKTRSVFDEFGGDNVFMKSCELEKGQKWFDYYEGEKVLLFDEMYPGQYPLAWLLRVTDRYKMQLEQKHDGCWKRWHTVIITTNCHPSTLFPGARPEHWKPWLRRLGDNAIHYFANTTEYEDELVEAVGGPRRIGVAAPPPSPVASTASTVPVAFSPAPSPDPENPKLAAWLDTVRIPVQE